MYRYRPGSSKIPGSSQPESSPGLVDACDEHDSMVAARTTFYVHIQTQVTIDGAFGNQTAQVTVFHELTPRTRSAAEREDAEATDHRSGLVCWRGHAYDSLDAITHRSIPPKRVDARATLSRELVEARSVAITKSELLIREASVP